MKQKIIIAMLVLSLAIPAHAFLFPAFMYFGMPAAAVDLSLIVHGGAAAALWWYNKKTGTNAVDNSGNLTNDGAVQWVELKDSKLATYQAPTKNQVPFTDLQNKVLENSTSKARYPKLAQALQTGDTLHPNDQFAAVGMFMNNRDGASSQVTSSQTSNVWLNCAQRGDCNTPLQWASNNQYTYYWDKSTSGYWQKSTTVIMTLASLNMNPATPSQFQTSYTNQKQSDPNVFSGEIDDFIKSNPNIVHFKDSDGNDADSQIPSTGNLSGSPGPLTQADIDRKTAMDSAVSAANAAARQAWLNYSAAKGTLPTGQGDQNLYGKYLDAKAGAAGAEGSNASGSVLLDGIKDALGKLFGSMFGDSGKTPSQNGAAVDDAATKDEFKNYSGATGAPKTGSNKYDSKVDAPEKKNILQSIKDFVASSPAGSIIRSLSVDTSSPECVFTVRVFGRDVTFDFTPWQGRLEALGVILLTVTHGVGIFIMFRRPT